MPIIRQLVSGLPDVIGHHSVAIAGDRIRKSSRLTEGAIVGITHECADYDDERRRRGGAPKENSNRRPVLSEEKPVTQDRRYGQTYKNTLVWTSRSEEHDADC